jgi:hypothetical protein
VTLPTDLSGPQADGDNRAWHDQIRAALPGLELDPVMPGTTGHLAHHAVINAHVNAETAAGLPEDPQENDPDHELHHNIIHAYVNGLDGPVLGAVVHTQAEINAWSTSSSEYTALSNRTFMSLSRSVTDHGSTFATRDLRNLWRDDSVYIKCQAALWAADGNATRRTKVIAMLDGMKNVRGFDDPQNGQDNLVLGWGMTNVCQAARVVGYSDSDFDGFCDWAYPLLDWSSAFNWFASFADSRTAVASYRQDPERWEDAKAYTEWHLRRSVYHSTFDQGFVVPLRGFSTWPSKTTGNVHLFLTWNHWGGGLFDGDAAQIKGGPTSSDPVWLDAEYPWDQDPPVPFPDGTSSERLRDLSHTSMGTHGFVHAARTILACNDTLPAEVYVRLRAACDYHAQACNHNFTNPGEFMAPAPIGGDGGAARFWGHRAAIRLFKNDAPASLHEALTYSVVQNAAPEGGNHQSGERFTDEIT